VRASERGLTRDDDKNTGVLGRLRRSHWVDRLTTAAYYPRCASSLSLSSGLCHLEARLRHSSATGQAGSGGAKVAVRLPRLALRGAALPPAPTMTALAIAACRLSKQPPTPTHQPQRLPRQQPHHTAHTRTAHHADQVSTLAQGRGCRAIGYPADTRNRVRTLTGKEIELDIEPDYKVGFSSPQTQAPALDPGRRHAV
jgi:hypothetical protein